MDETEHLSSYQQSPWDWTRGVRQDVAFLWSWHNAVGYQNEIVHARVDTILSMGRRVPFPAVQFGDEQMRKSFEDAAEVEMNTRRTPCRYLGIELPGGQYEPDPSKWPAAQYSSRRKTQATVFYEWTHVLGRGGEVHRVGVQANNLLHNHRFVPQSPLAASAPSGLTFTVEFVEALAKALHEHVEFKGIAYEGERNQLVRHLPHGGVDCQDDPLYWTLPDGRCVCQSLRELASMRDDELAPQESHDAYVAVAEQLGYDALGRPENEEAFEEFRLDPGNISGRRWSLLNWLRPADETASCWWVANAAEIEGEAPVKLVCRSLHVLRLELHATRRASSVKLRQERERRLENNARAVDVLEKHCQLWRHVGGPLPECLRQPSDRDLHSAMTAVATLQRLLRRRETAGKTDDGLAVFAEEINVAVRRIKSITWEAIRRERFPLTPQGLYEELCRNAQILLERRPGDAARRHARLVMVEASVDQEKLELLRRKLKRLYRVW